MFKYNKRYKGFCTLDASSCWIFAIFIQFVQFLELCYLVCRLLELQLIPLARVSSSPRRRTSVSVEGLLDFFIIKVVACGAEGEEIQ